MDHIPVYIISLARAAERREYMANLMKQLGLEARFIEAVDGRSLTPAQRRRYNPSRARRIYGCEMSDTEIACYLSHLHCYARMLKDRARTALILEDDVSCAPDLRQTVDKLLAAPGAWQVVRLQATKRHVAMPENPRQAGECVASVDKHTIFRVRRSVLGMCAYLIRDSAARTMLAKSRQIFMPIDQTLDRFWETGIVPYIVRPVPVWHEDRFDSEIGDRGRKLEPRASFGATLTRRVQRIADAFNKRIFWLAYRVPTAGAMLAFVGVASARVGLAALWDPSFTLDPVTAETLVEDA